MILRNIRDLHRRRRNSLLFAEMVDNKSARSVTCRTTEDEEEDNPVLSPPKKVRFDLLPTEIAAPCNHHHSRAASDGHVDDEDEELEDEERFAELHYTEGDFDGFRSLAQATARVISRTLDPINECVRFRNVIALLHRACCERKRAGVSIDSHVGRQLSELSPKAALWVGLEALALHEVRLGKVVRRKELLNHIRAIQLGSSSKGARRRRASDSASTTTTTSRRLPTPRRASLTGATSPSSYVNNIYRTGSDDEDTKAEQIRLECERITLPARRFAFYMAKLCIPSSPPDAGR